MSLTQRLLHPLLVAVAVAVTACGGANLPEGEIHRAVSAQPESLHPHAARSVASAKILGDLYEGLLTRDAAGALAPGVASAWSVTDDGRTYTFELREDARWSDGSRVTATDFVRSWRRLVNPDTGAFYADLLLPVRGVRAVLEEGAPAASIGVRAAAPTTLVVSLDAPRPDFPERLAHPSTAPVHDDARVSNGAYALQDAVPGSHVSLTRNPHFHAAETVSIPAVRYWTIEREQTEYNRFRAGELDVTSRVPAQAFAETPRPAALRTAPYLGVVYLGINLRRAPLGDQPGVRRALSLATDRDFLASRIAGRGEQPAWHFVPPGVSSMGVAYEAATPAYAAWTQDERNARAATLFANAGYGPDKPLSIDLHYASSDENRRLAAALQSMWQAALPGLTVVLNNKEFRVLLAENRRGDLAGVFRASWIADFNDPAHFLGVLGSGSPANATGFADSRFDALLAAAAVSEDPRRRHDILRSAEAMMLDQHPIVPLYFFVSKHLVSDRVRGWRDNPLDLHYSRYLSLGDRAAGGG
jgi:ABC-type oligopeptide transport system substrate-binding subunit